MSDQKILNQQRINPYHLFRIHNQLPTFSSLTTSSPRFTQLLLEVISNSNFLHHYFLSIHQNGFLIMILINVNIPSRKLMFSSDGFRSHRLARQYFDLIIKNIFKIIYDPLSVVQKFQFSF